MLDRIRFLVTEVHVTPRCAAMVAAPAIVVAWLPGMWGPILSWAWVVFALVVIGSDLTRTPRAAQLHFKRVLPTKFSIGVPNQVRLVVHNASAVPARLDGRESPPVGFEGDRALGPIEVPPHDSREIDLSFIPPSRGAYSFGDIGIRVLGPRGLAGRRIVVPMTEDIRVYPDISAVRGYALMARRGALQEIGIRAARFAGVGTEFESLAEYGDGDDYRDIDWKATARRGSPVVRRFEAERSQTIVLAIDAGRMMTPRVGDLTKLDRAINATLLLAHLAITGGDNVGLLVFGRDVRRYLPPRRGHRQFLAILEELYSVEGRIEEPDYALAIRYLAARLGKRSLVVLMTDLAGMEPSRRLLGVLGTLAPRHLPLVMTQRNRAVEAMATRVPDSESEAFESAVAESLLHDKAAAVRLLASRGSMVLDVHPEDLSVAVVNRYLEIKARGRL